MSASTISRARSRPSTVAFHPSCRVRLGRVADQGVDLGRAEVALVETHVVLPVQSGVRERDLEELTDREAHTGGEHVVVGLVRLQHPPHALDVLGGVAPVTHRVEVPHVEVLLLSGLDGGDGARDLAGHEGLAAPRGLVVEQDPVGRVHPVGLAVVPGDPVAVELRGRVGRARIERRVLVLRRRGRAEQLGRRRLVEPGLDPGEPHRLEHADGPGAGRVGGVLGLVERHPHVRLRGEVVDLVGLDRRAA